MFAFDTTSITDLLIQDTESALERVSTQHTISGFAYVFEVGQPEPCFHLAIDTGPPPSDPSTSEWTHPAGGFDGAQMSPEWDLLYALLSAYMDEDDELESRIHEVHALFRAVMRQIRAMWSERLPGCIFTVNECNDSDEFIHATYVEINQPC